MSGFVNRKKAVDTVNPAGGINPASSPNVGQYGWTSYDSSNVNQIIQYVDLCKKYTETVIDTAAYVQGKYAELKEFMSFIEDFYEEMKPIYDNIEIVYEDIKVRHEDIKVRHTDIITKHSQIDSWTNEAATSASKAKESEDNAKISEVNSKSSEVGSKEWYDKSYELYDELRKGNVYRGTWNPHTGAYPSHNNTNSTWDVILNEGELEYLWNGILWFWGDRLVYIKDTNEYQQIESGTTVSSVNGKKGAVTITLEELGGLNKSGDTMDGTLYLKDSSKYISITDEDVRVGSSNGSIKLEGKENPIARVGATNYTIYHQGYKPTAGDVGALPITGGTLGGDLAVNGNFHAKNAVLVNTANVVGVDGSVARFGDSSYSRGFRISAKDGNLTVNPSSSTSYRVYHEGFKPSAADVGALPTTGGNLSGNLNIRGSLLINDTDVAGADSSVTRFGNFSRVARIIAKDGEAYIGSSSSSYTRIYHQGFKPTASDIGALPTTGGTATGPLAGTFLGVTNNSITSGNGLSLYGSYTGGKPNYGMMFAGTETFGKHGYITGDWCTYFTMTTGSAGTRGWVFKHADSNVASISQDGNFYVNGQTNAASLKVGTHSADGWPNNTNSNTGNYNNKYLQMLYRGNNAMYTFMDGTTNSRRGGIQVGHSSFDYSTSYGILELNPYGGVVRANGYAVYHQGYKPTAADVGALPITGGTVNGNVAVDGNFHAKGAVLVNTRNVIGVDDTIARFGDSTYSRATRIAAKNGDLSISVSSTVEHKVYHEGFKPTAFDIQVTDPRTKKEETLMEVLLTMKAELDHLKEELLITKEKLNEFILK